MDVTFLYSINSYIFIKDHIWWFYVKFPLRTAFLYLGVSFTLKLMDLDIELHRKVSRWIWYFYLFSVNFLMLWDILFRNYYHLYVLVLQYFFIHIISERVEIFISYIICKWYIKWWMQCAIITLCNFLNRVIFICYCIFQ